MFNIVVKFLCMYDPLHYQRKAHATCAQSLVTASSGSSFYLPDAVFELNPLNDIEQMV